MTDDTRVAARRQFLKFLAASPYVAACGGLSVFLEQRIFAQNGAASPAGEVIASPADALNVLDFEESLMHVLKPVVLAVGAIVALNAGAGAGTGSRQT
jgi:hypothetical protein